MTDALKMFVEACGGNPPEFLQEAFAAAEDAIERNRPALDLERDWIAREARRYAGFYPEASDGRNTFIMFAEMIESRVGKPPEEFLIGDQTMAKVFKPAGLTNLSDLQAVFDAVERALTSALSAIDDDDKCPVCDEPLNNDDLCATDIELGICHAKCLAGVPVVDLDTGEPTGGEIDTYRYGDLDTPAPQSRNEQGAIDAYKAENAKHGWSGRNFGMQGAHLSLDKSGNAMILFKEEDLQYDESGPYIALSASEMVELRDYLADAFPAVALSAPDVNNPATLEKYDFQKFDVEGERHGNERETTKQLSPAPQERDKEVSDEP